MKQIAPAGLPRVDSRDFRFSEIRRISKNRVDSSAREESSLLDEFGSGAFKMSLAEDRGGSVRSCSSFYICGDIASGHVALINSRGED